MQVGFLLQSLVKLSVICAHMIIPNYCGDTYYVQISLLIELFFLRDTYREECGESEHAINWPTLLSGGRGFGTRTHRHFVLQIVSEDIIKINTHIKSVIHSTLACVVHFILPQY